MKETETETDENPAVEYQAKMAALHVVARDIAREVFGIDKPHFSIINGVFDRIVYHDDDCELNESETEDSKQDLISARAWALEVYGDDSPEATLAAYDAAFELDDE